MVIPDTLNAEKTVARILLYDGEPDLYMLQTYQYLHYNTSTHWYLYYNTTAWDNITRYMTFVSATQKILLQF